MKSSEEACGVNTREGDCKRQTASGRAASKWKANIEDLFASVSDAATGEVFVFEWMETG